MLRGRASALDGSMMSAMGPGAGGRAGAPIGLKPRRQIRNLIIHNIYCTPKTQLGLHHQYFNKTSKSMVFNNRGAGGIKMKASPREQLGASSSANEQMSDAGGSNSHHKIVIPRNLKDQQ